MSELLRIGDLAARVGVTASAVRFYESKGLLDPDARVAGQRRYAPSAVERLQLIAALRRAGLGVADIAVALDRSPETTAERHALAAARAIELREQISLLLSALIVVEHASHCTRPTDDQSCRAEIDAQREHALDRAEKLLADVAAT